MYQTNKKDKKCFLGCHILLQLVPLEKGCPGSRCVSQAVKRICR